MYLQWFNEHSNYIFPFYFAGLWILVSVAISFLGGWHALAKYFRMQQEFQGQKWNSQSASLGSASYNNVLTFGVNEEGLYLSTLFLFRVAHPPLFIPWSEISITQKKHWFWGKYTQLRLGCELQIPLNISTKLAQKLQAAAGSRWLVESLV